MVIEFSLLSCLCLVDGSVSGSILSVGLVDGDVTEVSVFNVLSPLDGLGGASEKCDGEGLH